MYASNIHYAIQIRLTCISLIFPLLFNCKHSHLYYCLLIKNVFSENPSDSLIELMEVEDMENDDPFEDTIVRDDDDPNVRKTNILETKRNNT